jgi:hypothetical protein
VIHALRSWMLWWLALFGLYVVMQGTNEQMELAAGAGAAALGASLLELVRRQGLLRFAPGARALAQAGRVPFQVIREFLVITVALVLDLTGRRRIRGAWVAVPFEAGGDDPVSAGNRALAPLLNNVSPNTVVVDIECDRNLALRHDLVPARAAKTVP